MYYNTLIIDDNHSFIDSLKVILREQPFRIESTYKYFEARKILQKQSSYINHESVFQILDYEVTLLEMEKQAKNALKDQQGDEPPLEVTLPEAPVLKAPVFNSEGFALVIVEYDTETSTKGHQFITELLQNSNHWREEDFILLTSDTSKLSPQVKKLNIPIIEKPIKHNALKQLLNQKLTQLTSLEQKLNQISADHQISLNPPEKTSTPGKKRASVPAKSSIKASSTKKKKA